MHPALNLSLADRLTDLGDISPSRVRLDPSPGRATVDDLIRISQIENRHYELIDGTLVEKAMGWLESMLAGVLLQWLNNYLDQHPIGVATGADGFSHLFIDTVRGPDVAFVSWERLPDGIPVEPIPNLVPNLVIEVLSKGNTRAEMSRKRREYFHAGVQIVWMIDPRSRSVAVYTSSEEVTLVDEQGRLDGGSVLPDWRVDVKELFARIDRHGPQADIER